MRYERAGSWYSDGGGLPTSRDQLGDILQVRSKFGGLDVSEARRLRSLEEDNSRLKKLLAEAMLDNAVLKDLTSKMVTPGAKREAFAHARNITG